MRALILATPDVCPHFIDHRFMLPSGAGPILAANAPEHDIKTADLVLKRRNIKRTIKELISKYSPQLIGISAMSFQFFTACEIARFIRTLKPNIKIVLGGYHVTLMEQELEKDPAEKFFDFFIRGEGEQPFKRLLDAIEKKQDFDQIKGLSFKREGKWYHNPKDKLLDLNKAPLPNRNSRIFTRFQYYGRQLDVVETSRGCTMKCNFCSMSNMYGRIFRTYPIEHVLKDIEDAKAHKATYIFFTDDNITLDINRFEKLCLKIIEARHNDIMYLVQANVLGISSKPELAEVMYEAGIKMVFLGIENVSSRSLKEMKKGNIIEHTRRAVRYLQNAGILVTGGMIVGFPHETKEDIEKNFKFFSELGVWVADQVVTPYPKTEIREKLLNLGLITNIEDFRRYNGFWANVKTKYLSPWDLAYLRWLLYRKYYSFRPPPLQFKEYSPFLYYILKYIRAPLRKIRFYLKPKRYAFKRYMKKYAKLNHFFDPYPPLLTEDGV